MLSQYIAAVWVRICICLILAKIFADIKLLKCLILVIFCDTKEFQLLNFATFFDQYYIITCFSLYIYLKNFFMRDYLLAVFFVLINHAVS